MAIVSDVEIRLRADIARLQQDMNAARRSVDTAMNGIAAAAQRAAFGLGGIAGTLGLSEIIKAADQYAKFTAQLRIATDGTREYGRAMADVRRIANSSQADLAATGTLYARIASGTQDLGLSQQKVADIVEATNLSLKVSGATSQESASAILQLSQAFGAGALRGEEFNAVNEAAPRLLRAIADGLGVPVGQLKEMASQGKLTAEVLADVLPKALGKLRGEASEVQTIAGAFTVLKNNLLEIIGTSSQSSGAVSALTTVILALANNLDVVAGAVVTLTAARLASWFDASASSALRTVTANRAAAASTLATAEAAATATARASLLANARLAEVRAATLAAAGATQLALATNGLIPAQVRAAAAAEAHTLAMGQLAIAQRAASMGTTAVSGVIAALGGPIGAIITVLGLAATAWSVYQSRQEEANRKASENTEASTAEIISSLEKQNAKLRERIELSKQAGMADIAKGGGPGAERLAATLKQINDLKAKGNRLTAVDQVELITLEGIYADLNKAVGAVNGSKAELDATGTAATDLVAVRERLTGVNKQYLDDLQKLQMAREKGAVGEKEYVALVTKLAQETWKSSDAGKAAENQMKSSVAAAKSAAQVYGDLIDKIHGRADGQDADFQQNIAILYKGYLAGKQSLSEYVATVEAYIKQQKSSIEIDKQKAKALKEVEDFQKEYAKGFEAMSKVYEESLKDAEKETEKNEELAQTFGKTKAAIEQVELARLKEQLASRASLALTLDEIEHLEKVISLKERSAKALADVEQLEETRDFWKSVGETARDTFRSIADGGKDLGKRLKDTLKNTFFDWLYQQTIKKWIINIKAEATGGLDGITNSLGLGSVKGMLAQYMPAIATAVVAYGVGKAISGDKKVGGTGLANIISSFGVVGGLFNRAFGMGDKKYADSSTLVGSLGSGGFSGTRNTAWSQEGGWLRSNRSGVDKAPVDAQLAASLASAYKGIQEATTQYAKVLGLNADSIAARAQTLNIALGKDEAANEKAIADFFGGVADTIASEVMPGLSQFQREGETAAVTLQRLAENFQGVEEILAAMGTDSQTMFGAVGAASITARERLVDLAGGVQNLGTMVGYFQQNILSEADRVAAAQGPLRKSLESLGYASLKTTDDYKKAVLGLMNSGALATEEGAKQYAGLLALGPQFKMVADYMAELGSALADVGKEVADMLGGLVDDAMAGLRRAVDAQKERVTAAYEETMRGLEKSIDAVNATIERTGALSRALRGAITAPAGDSAMRGQVARAEITAALAIARASGVLPTEESLADALATVGVDSSDDFSTLQEYQRAVARTNAELEALGGLSDKELSNAEKQLKALEDQKAATTAAYEAELQRLDKILEQAQAQVDAIKGVDNSVRSVEAALGGLQTVLGALKSIPTPANPGGSGGSVSVEDLYRQVLGRAPDAAGLEFWKKAFGDAVDQSEYLEFVKGARPELEGLVKAPPMVATGSGTMSSSSAMVAELQTLNRRMESVETSVANTATATGQFAQQFHQVSAGGNALATEAI